MCKSTKVSIDDIITDLKITVNITNISEMEDVNCDTVIVEDERGNKHTINHHDLCVAVKDSIKEMVTYNCCKEQINMECNNISTYVINNIKRLKYCRHEISDLFRDLIDHLEEYMRNKNA